MADGNDAQVGSESEVNPKGEEAVANENEDQNVDSGESKGRATVTPEVLQGSQDALKRWLKEDIQKNVGPVRDEIKKLLEQHQSLMEKNATNQSPDSAPEKTPELDPPELIELRKQNAELDDAVSKLRASLEDAQTKERDYRFETQVKDALTRAGCTKPDVAYRVIAPELSMDEDGRKVFATVEGEFGTEELNIGDYIDRVAKESTIPELFQGLSRTGSPAGGDEGGGIAKHLYTKEQISDPEFYAENRDKIRKALDAGLVKGYDDGQA